MGGAAGMIAARGSPQYSRGGGARHRCVWSKCTRIPTAAWPCKQQGSRVVSMPGHTHAPMQRERERYPVRTRTGQLINSFSLSVVSPPARAARLLLLPPTRAAHGWGRFHPSINQPRLRAARQPGQGRPGLPGSPRPGGDPRAGPGLAVGRVDAVRSRARALKLSLGPHVAMAILVMGCSEYWVATQMTESRR